MAKPERAMQRNWKRSELQFFVPSFHYVLRSYTCTLHIMWIDKKGGIRSIDEQCLLPYVYILISSLFRKSY